MDTSRHALFHALDPGSTGPTPLWVRVGLRSAVCAGLTAALLHNVSVVHERHVAVNAVLLAVLLLMAAEYALRLYAATAGPRAVPGRPAITRLQYALSLVGLVDLAAVAPMAAALVLGSWPQIADTLGILWVLKLARYSPNLEVLGRVLKDARKPLMSVLLLFGSRCRRSAACSPVW